MLNPSIRALLAVSATVALGACASAAPTRANTAPEPAIATLKDTFRPEFMIGAAIADRHFTETDARGAALVATQFNTITSENVVKWERVHPEPGRYNFGPTDRYVEFGERHGMFIVGHTLVWHSQTPRWVFQDASGAPLGRDSLLARMREHIHTVVGRYKGRIKGWDVVNEALEEDGTLRNSPWRRIIGDDYIAKAFEFAREADPDVELYYNDYSLENAPKRNGAVALIRSLQEQGIKVSGIGLQGHNKMDWPTLAQQDSTLAAFAALGIHIMITELDVDVLPSSENRGADVGLTIEARPDLNPYPGSLPDSVQTALAARYADLFSVYSRYRDAITRVTFWGVTDADSWLNNWPIRGRSSYPLLFDREGRPKPAFQALLAAARLRAGFVP
jgi:endo-1,4-beta-xylanase